MKKMIAALALLSTTAVAQPQQFSTERLTQDIRTLSSDEFEGRGPATPGEQKTIAYISEGMKAAGLEPAGDDFTATASLPVAGATVALDLSGAIDFAAERKRLAKDLAAAEKELAQAGAKLGNDGFLAKAPDKVVEGIRHRSRTAQADIERLTAQLAALPQA